MTSDPLAWQEFDPTAGELPAGVERVEAADEGTVAALTILVSSEARRDGWAPRAAAGIAGAWARTHGSAFLADLDLRRPELHHVVEEANGEGITDVVLWGASLGRVARPVDGGALALVPAGTVVADPERVLTGEGWDEVGRQASGDGRSLLLYLPLDEPGAVELARRSASVVVLAKAGERERLLPDLGELPVRAVLGPPETSRSAPGDGGGERAPVSEPESGRPGEEPTEKGAGGGRGAEGGPGRTGRGRGKTAKGPGRRVLFWVLVLVLVVAAGFLVAEQTGLVEVPFSP